MPTTLTDNQPDPIPFTILVAEDNPVNRQVIALLFKQLSIPVEFAADGQQALDLASSGQHPIILMDIQMPLMDGIQATHHIRTTFPPHRQPVIIALTAQTDETKADYIALGFDDYLKKPLKSASLKSMLDQYLSQPPTAPKISLPSPMEATPPSSLEMDVSVLDEMLADLGEGCEDLLVNLINTYLSHTPTLFAALDQALIADDLTTIHRVAHTLKSSSANLGAMRLSELSKQLEARLKPMLNISLNSQDLGKMRLEIKHQVELMQTTYTQASTSLKAYQLKLQERLGWGE